MYPFQQGSLDGLCGIYAAINAAKLITGRINLLEGQELLLECLTAMEKKKAPIEFITEGTGILEVNRILRDVICPYCQLSKTRPFYGQSRVTLDEFWTRLTEFLHGQKPASVIFSYENMEYSHWTVAQGITNKRIILFDSWHRKQIDRRYCTTKGLSFPKTTLLYPSATFFLNKS